MKAMRAEKLTVDEIFRRQQMKFPRFESSPNTDLRKPECGIVSLPGARDYVGGEFL